VVEIYPRLLTGAVGKSIAGQWAVFLPNRFPSLRRAHLASAAKSEDAFDAAVSALVMIENVEHLLSLPPESERVFRAEGRIWHPGWRDNLMAE
jgi:hypothetical protein